MDELHSLRNLKEPCELMIPSESSITEYDQVLYNKRARSAGSHSTNLIKERKAMFQESRLRTSSGPDTGAKPSLPMVTVYNHDVSDSLDEIPVSNSLQTAVVNASFPSQRAAIVDASFPSISGIH